MSVGEMMEFTPFEQAALQALLGVDDDSTRILRLQVENASVVSREYTGGVFYGNSGFC